MGVCTKINEVGRQFGLKMADFHKFYTHSSSEETFIGK